MEMPTPWQKIHMKFGGSAASLAARIGRHRSKVTRALKDPKGLVSGEDMELLKAAADRCGVDLSLEDFLADADA